MKTRKHNYFVDSTTVLDKETGELGTIENRKRYSVTIESEPFYMVFIDYIAPLFSLTNATTKSVLSVLCTKAEFNTGKVTLSTADRNEMCEYLGINKTAISRAIKELVEKKLITGEKGTYIINPQIFWKGDLLTRNALLKVEDIKIAFEINTASANLEENPDS